jgi:cysteine sulfinate desulfinase/cysteine desulfurase-like protein
MLPFFTERFGNPHSKQHAFGWDARDATDSARAQVAALINASAARSPSPAAPPSPNNLALKGAVAPRCASSRGNHIVHRRHRAQVGARRLPPVPESGLDVTVSAWMPAACRSRRAARRDDARAPSSSA